MTPWSSGKWHENRVPPLLTNKFIFHWMYDCLGLLFFKANLFSFFFRIRRRSTRTDHSEFGGSPRGSQCRGRLLIHLWLRWHLLHPESGWILFVKDSGTWENPWLFMVLSSHFQGCNYPVLTNTSWECKRSVHRDWILKGTKHIRTETTNDIWYYQ